VPCPFFLIGPSHTEDWCLVQFFNSGLLIHKTGALSNYFNSGLLKQTGALSNFFNSGLFIQKTGALSNFFNSGLLIQKTNALSNFLIRAFSYRLVPCPNFLIRAFSYRLVPCPFFLIGPSHTEDWCLVQFFNSGLLIQTGALSIFFNRAFSYRRLVPCPIFFIQAFSYRLVPCPIF